MQLFKRKGRGKTPGDAAVAKTPAAEVSPPFANVTQSHSHAAAGDLTVGDYASGVPQIRIGTMVDVFRSQLKWMLPAILLGTAAAFYLTKDIQRTYTGEARVLVQLGSEYVYNPVASSAQSGLMLTPDHIVLNEVSIMTSQDVIKRVMGSVVRKAGGWAAFEPTMMGKSEEEKLRYFERALAAIPRAKSSVIDITFKHPNQEIAVLTVNEVLVAYKDKRQALFTADEVDAISGQIEFAETELRRNEQQIAAALRRNNISDFDSERTGATERTEALKAELNALRASTTEAEASLAEVEDQMRSTPRTIDLQVDDRASQRVAQAELELKQLLARYLPSSDPVRQKRVEIEELRALQAENGGRAVGGRRVGPNPVHQALETRRNELQATADSLREKEYVLQQQLNGADAKARRLRDLSPRFENLLRERETLQQRLRGLNTKEQDALVTRAQAAQAQSENVRVIAEADVARKGRNTRMIAFVLASALWAGTVFLLGLLRTFLDPRLYAREAKTGGSSASGGRRMSDRSSVADTVIPEPVAPYIPSTPTPQPVSEPAPPPFEAPAAVVAAPAMAMAVGGANPYAAEVYAEPVQASPIIQTVPVMATEPVMELDEQTAIVSDEPSADTLQPIFSATPSMDASWTPTLFADEDPTLPKADIPTGPASYEAVEWVPPQPSAPAMSDNPYMSADVAQAFTPPPYET